MFKSETSKKIASNTVYQVIGKVISMTITVLATVVVTRMYGREGYGEFSLMQTWPALFFVIVDFGINAIATRELSKDWALANKYIGNILIMRSALSLFLMLILWALLQVFPYAQPLRLGITLGLFLLVTQSLFTTTNIIFQVKLRYDLSTYGYVVGYLLILALILVLSISRAPVMWVNFSYVAGGLLTFALNYIFMVRLGVQPVFTLDREVISYLLVQSLPLGMMFVFSQINFKSDSILMSILPVPKGYGINTTEAVAIYALPYKIFEVSLVIPTFFMNSVYPVLVRHMQEGKERLKATFRRTMVFLVVSGIVSGVAGVVLSPLAIKLLGGSEFKQSVPVLQILIAGIVLYYLTQPIAWLLVTLERQKYLPVIYLISAVFNVSANYFLIPVYSFYASAVITHLSELLILVLLIFFALRAWKEKYVS